VWCFANNLQISVYIKKIVLDIFNSSVLLFYLEKRELKGYNLTTKQRKRRGKHEEKWQNKKEQINGLFGKVEILCKQLG